MVQEEKQTYIDRLMSLGMSENEAKIFILEIENNALIDNAQEHFIRIHYTDGDSFGSYNTTEDIEIRWKNINIIKENVKRINEHSDMVKKGEYEYNDHEEYTKEFLKQRWAVSKYELWIDIDTERYGKNTKKELQRDKTIPEEGSIKLLLDDGREIRISTPWTSYFASLTSVEVKPVNLGDDNEYYN